VRPTKTKKPLPPGGGGKLEVCEMPGGRTTPRTQENRGPGPLARAKIANESSGPRFPDCPARICLFPKRSPFRTPSAVSGDDSARPKSRPGPPPWSPLETAESKRGIGGAHSTSRPEPAPQPPATTRNCALGCPKKWPGSHWRLFSSDPFVFFSGSAAPPPCPV